MKKNVKITLVVIFLIALPVLKIGKSFLIDEGQDDEVHEQVFKASVQLHKYFVDHNQFPATLNELNIQEDYWYFPSKYSLIYTPSADLQSYTLAAGVHYPFISYATFPCAGSLHAADSCSGYAYAQSFYNKSAYPIYKNGEGAFATPSAWPDIDNGTMLDKIFYSIFKL